VGSSAGWILWKRTPYRGPHVPARIRTSSACRALILPILLRSPQYTVGKDGEVQYNKPLMFTKDNIDNFNY